MNKEDYNKRDTLTIAVIGSYSTGKTTVINSVFEEDVLYAHACPDTTLINEVRYGEKKEAILYFRNPLPESLPTGLSSKIREHIKRCGMNKVPPLRINYKEIKDYVAIPKGEDSKEMFLESPFEKVSLLMPHPMLNAGIAIIDMPGLTESYSRNKVVCDSLEKADFVLFVLSADQACSTEEINFIEHELTAFGSSKLIFVINRMDIIRNQDVESIKKFVENKLSIYTSNPIFFVSAQNALDGVKNGNVELVEKSGIPDLSNFLKKLVSHDGSLHQSNLKSYTGESKYNLVEKDKNHKEYHINNSTIKVVFGDILDSKAEVIVSSDDCNITMGGGVSWAIRQKEGTDAIRLDVKKMIPADIGDVVISTAGTLPQKNIFHIITIDYKDVEQSKIPGVVSIDDVHQYIIGHSIDKCFQLLHAIEMKSIAFPQIGAGVAGIPFNKVAEVMAESIGRNLRKTNKTFMVELYLYDKFEKMGHWDFLPMFEQFSAQEAISRILNEQVNSRLSLDETNSNQSDDSMPEIDKDIFISYSRKDTAIVKLIYDWLEKAGYKCWLDVDGMFSGVSYKKVIVDAIKHSKVLLFMSSENSNKSRNVVSEVSIAVEYGKKIIPIRLDMTSYSESIEYDIINHDYVVYDRSQMEESNREMLKKIVSTMEML